MKLVDSNIKNYIKTFIIFSIPMCILFCAVNPNYILDGIIRGGVAGLIFSVSMAVFSKISSKKFDVYRKEILKNEKLIIDGPANHFYKVEATGGWLFLTDKYIYFYCHNINIKKHNMRIPLTSILRVWDNGKLNQMQIDFFSEESQIFVVNNKKVWIREIEEAKSRLSTIK